MLRSAFASASSFSRVAASRFLSTTAVNFSQQPATPESAELEDLFYNSGNSNNIESTGSHASRNPSDNKKRFSWGINRVELLGGVAADPEFLVTKDGFNFSAFRIYTNVDYRRRDGTMQQQTEIHDVQVFSPGMVNYLKKNVKKGNRVYVSGNIHYLERPDFTRRALIKAELVQCIAKSKTPEE